MNLWSDGDYGLPSEFTVTCTGADMLEAKLAVTTVACGDVVGAARKVVQISGIRSSAERGECT